MRADYFAEEVRRELIKNPEIGENGLYKGGLYVRSTLNPKFQEIADRVLRAGLVRYDIRHGYRGPVAKIEPNEDWATKLAAVAPPTDLYQWRLAAVLSVDDKAARIGFADKTEGTMPLAELKWARKAENGVLPDKALAENAFALAKDERYEEALAVLDLLQDPNTAVALNYRGYATRKLGRVEEGIGYYLRSVALYPDYAQVRECLGEAYVQKGDIAAAMAQLQVIERICGTSCEEYTDLAEAIADARS